MNERRSRLTPAGATCFVISGDLSVNSAARRPRGIWRQEHVVHLRCLARLLCETTGRLAQDRAALHRPYHTSAPDYFAPEQSPVRLPYEPTARPAHDPAALVRNLDYR